MRCKIQRDPALIQRFPERLDPVCRRDIQIADRTGINNDALRIRPDRRLQIAYEQMHIRKIEIARKAVEDHVFDRLRIGIALQRMKSLMTGNHTEKGALRIRSLQGQLDKGQDHADHHARDRPEEQHAGECAEEDQQLAFILFQQPVRQIKFHCAEQRGNDDRRQHRHGQIPDEPRAEQQDTRHCDGRRQRHDLRFSAVLLAHCRAGDRAVDRTAAGQTGGEIAESVDQDLAVILHAVAVFVGEAVRCQQRFGHDDCRDRKAGCQDIAETVRRHRRQMPCRKTCGCRLQHPDPVSFRKAAHAERRACRHDKDRHRQLRRELFSEQQHCERNAARQQRHRMKIRPADRNDMPYQLRQLTGSAAAAEQLRDLHENDRRADAADKAAHDRRGDICRQPAGFQYRKEDQPQPREQRDDRNNSHRLRRAGRDPVRREIAPDQRCRRRIDTENKLRGFRAKRKNQDREDRAVKPADSRQSGDLRIAH